MTNQVKTFASFDEDQAKTVIENYYKENLNHKNLIFWRENNQIYLDGQEDLLSYILSIPLLSSIDPEDVNDFNTYTFNGLGNKVTSPVIATDSDISLYIDFIWGDNVGGDEATLLSKFQGTSYSTERAWLWRINSSSQISFFVSSSSSQTNINISTTITPGTRYKLLLTHNKSTGETKTYKDGVLIDTQTTSILFDDVSKPITLGNWTSNYYDNYRGAIYDARVYTRILSGGDITNPPTSDANLVMYYDLENSYFGNNRILDLSGNGNHGTYTGKVEFERDSVASFKDFENKVVFVEANEPRFQGARRVSAWNYSELDSNGKYLQTIKGFLSETSATNLLTYSESLDNTTGGWTETSCTVDLNNVSSPTGETTGTKITEYYSPSTNHGISKTVSLSDSTDYVFSVFAKVGERIWIRLTTTNKAGSIESTWFNLSTGEIGTSNHSVADIEEYYDGWYRISVLFNSSTGGTTPQTYIRIADADNSNSYSGDGTSSLYVFGAQLEEEILTSYIKTEGATVTREADDLHILGDFDSIKSASVEFETLTDSNSDKYIFMVSDNSFDNYVSLHVESTDDNIYFQMYDTSVSQVSQNQPFTFNQDYKFSVYFDTNSSRAFTNGSAITTEDTSCTIPTGLNIINIGNHINTTSGANSTIKSVKFYFDKLTDEQARLKTI